MGLRDVIRQDAARAPQYLTPAELRAEIGKLGLKGSDDATEIVRAMRDSR